MPIRWTRTWSIHGAWPSRPRVHSGSPTITGDYRPFTRATRERLAQSKFQEQRRSPGAPTGVVYNSTTNFVVGSDQPARFVFSGEDGTLSAWGRGTNATLVVDNSGAHAIYKGLALATIGDSTFLYAPDFHNGRIDVFDGQFKPVVWPGAFVDPDLPLRDSPLSVSRSWGRDYLSAMRCRIPIEKTIFQVLVTAASTSSNRTGTSYAASPPTVL